ncbi:MAG: prepilin-type N-terminal cleavage/methylation domain-containing protein [Planctomycetes bacterium]|nr:prepilin-type N-terminal cleavage/methylation domain-containing protein [Planctomycetota bacterium]MCB9918499.1 prepilin-type N-terminal cleavage/methylation domain-containing protein [Planctomycetota bacterium]
MTVQRQHAFTLVELLVVMFLLTGFFLFLTQMLNSSLTVWQRGEERASIEERCATSLRLASRDFRHLVAVEDKMFRPGVEARLRGSTGTEGARSNGRLVATFVPFAGGKPVRPDQADLNPKGFDWLPEWRFVSRVERAEGRRLLEARERERVIATDGQLDEITLAERVAERLRDAPAAPPVECALRVLPTTDESGCYLALYRDVRLIDSSVQKRWVDGAELPPPEEPLLTHLLHIETLFRSQWTESFGAEVAREGGPERCWDSTRAGMFPPDHPVLAFSLDAGESSATDPRDDVMPSWIQLSITVDEGPEAAYTAFLAHAIDAVTTEIRIEYPERVPPVDDVGFLKIGSEWIQYRGHEGGHLRNVLRGARFTKATEHGSGSRVHAGRQGVVRIPVAVSREHWPHVR